jgi:hypothetical protein
MLKIILFIIILITIYKFYDIYLNTENFNRTHGKWCENCKEKSFGQCLDCFNCGFCITESGKGYCTKGNVFGPKDSSEKCKRWIHNDEFSSMLNLKNICRD